MIKNYVGGGPLLFVAAQFWLAEALNYVRGRPHLVGELQNFPVVLEKGGI